MKILMIVRQNLYTSKGGDTTQIDMTAYHLRNLGIDVEIGFSNLHFDYLKYDLIHFFNIIRPDDILPFINNATIPYVVSTIFVDYSEYEKKNRKGFLWFVIQILSSGQIEYIKAIARWIKNGDKIKSNYYLLHGHKASISKIAKSAKILLPNSNHEYIRFCNYINLSPKYKKVVNSIDVTIFNDFVVENKSYKNHVICVGRIEGRKNQLSLIKALMGEEVHLTIIGRPSNNHVDYYNQCKKLASFVSNIHFIEHIDHTELVKIYKAAKVHVLPSWFETTGLSSLEAGVMDCNIVITKKGDTEEYFQDMAFYCEPNDINSIKQAVLKAYYSPVDSRLKEFILTNYTWTKTAEQTLAAYKELLEMV